MTLRFEVEWQDAPGVRDVVLAATWCRLAIRLDHASGTTWLTELIDRSGQARRGVYGACFPLARWLVDSYWSLLWEVPRTPRRLPGRELGQYPALRPWVQRHNVLAAREGFSLPDLSFARDGDAVVLVAYPDSDAETLSQRPVSFVARGVFRLPRADVAFAIREFISTVLERLRDVDHEDVARLREDWDAILASEKEEPDLCQWAAQLGLDPYDPAELDDDLVALFESKLRRYSTPLRVDVLDGVLDAAHLETSLRWIDSQLPAANGRVPTPDESLRAADPLQSAHQMGYARARSLRRAVGAKKGAWSPVSVVGQKLGFDLGARKPVQLMPPDTINGLVGGFDRDVPAVVSPDLVHEDAVFLWARALCLWVSDELAQGPRLITRSFARVQRESRAFAAEFLAPSELLAERIDKKTILRDDDVTTLAAEFSVRPIVIRHQIQNHSLAIVDDD